MPVRVQAFFRVIGRVGITFLVLLCVWAVLDRFTSRPQLQLLVLISLVISGIWLAVRLLRIAVRQATWRLRNRLLVTYL
ncbi:MAG TPA: hypothetical protein VGP79_10410, partial [Bryobacteraceae bacterium]|nr:hypothetical protein [Bryobacteraceae bacterium]